MHSTANMMCEAKSVFPGTGTGVVSIVLSALKATRLGETHREGQFFATDLGRSAVPLLYITLMRPCSIRDTYSIPQHGFQHQISHSTSRFASTPHAGLG